jgi:excisionase family DNA binding protein
MPSANQIQWESLTVDPLERLSTVAKALGLSPDTLRRYVRTGVLPGIKIGGPHGFYKVRRSAVLRLLGAKNEAL